LNEFGKNGYKKETSYGRIEESAIGGIFMPRSIKAYEMEIIELKNQGKSNRVFCAVRYSWSSSLPLRVFLLFYRQNKNPLFAVRQNRGQEFV